MAIGTEQSAERFDDIVVNTPLNNPYPLYAEDEIEVIYGSQSLKAILNTDYTVQLFEDDFDHFTVTPLLSLLNKINALISDPPTEVAEENFVVVRRVLNYETTVQPETVRNTPFLSREIDRIHMKLIQIAERVARSIGLPDNVVGDLLTQYSIGAPVEGKAGVWRGNVLVPEIDADDIANAQEYAADAETALAATLVALEATEDARDAALAAAAALPLHNYSATTNPTVNDDSGDGYTRGSRWINATLKEAYTCVDNTLGAAVWQQDTLTVDELTALYATAAQGVKADSAIQPANLSGAVLYGLIMSNAAGDATNDIDMTAGAAISDDGTTLMTYAGGTVETDAVFDDTGNKGLDTGAVGNNSYHIYLIKNPSNGNTKLLVSLSATAPTMPSGYTKKKLIQSILREGGAIRLFKQRAMGGGAVYNEWMAPDASINDASPGTSAKSGTIKVPTGRIFEAVVYAYLQTSSGGALGLVTALDTTDTAPSTTIFNMVGDTPESCSRIEVHTNTSAQIRYRQTSGNSPSVTITTMGYMDSRA